MGKTSKWFKNLLTGKKEKAKRLTDNEQPTHDSVCPEDDVKNLPTTPISIIPTTPKEKRRWSFRRASSAATAPAGNGNENKQEMEMAAATTAVADAAVAAAQAAAAAVRLTAVTTDRATATGEAAATRIQSVFRGYLARKALCALKGLVKLQALVRGHLVRKRATATLRCMQALVTVQARARAQRIRTVHEVDSALNLQFYHRNSVQDDRYTNPYHELERGIEENIKIVEMDTQHPKANLNSRNSYSYQGQEDQHHRFSTHSAPNRGYSKQELYYEAPSPSLTEKSFRTYSGRFDDYSYNTAQSSPQCYYSVASNVESLSSYNDYTACPSYMQNTASSKAKFRSQSAPKSRPESQDRPPSRKKTSIEGRNVPRAMKMQRSSSHIASPAQSYQYPGSIKLDKSTVSLKGSECGSTNTILTNTNYCRSLVGFQAHGNRY